METRRKKSSFRPAREGEPLITIIKPLRWRQGLIAQVPRGVLKARGSLPRGWRYMREGDDIPTRFKLVTSIKGW